MRTNAMVWVEVAEIADYVKDGIKYEGIYVAHIQCYYPSSIGTFRMDILVDDNHVDLARGRVAAWVLGSKRGYHFVAMERPSPSPIDEDETPIVVRFWVAEHAVTVVALGDA